MTTPPSPETAARDGRLRRSKAIAAAASFGGFASLVAVLLGSPLTSGQHQASVSSSVTSSAEDTDDDNMGSDDQASTPTAVVPDTVTRAS